MADARADIDRLAQMLQNGDAFIDEEGNVSLRPPRAPDRARIVGDENGRPWPVMPPLRQHGPPATTNEFALSDFVEDKTGSPLAGTIVDNTAKMGRSVGGFASGTTGIPMLAGSSPSSWGGRRRVGELPAS